MYKYLLIKLKICIFYVKIILLILYYYYHQYIVITNYQLKLFKTILV